MAERPKKGSNRRAHGSGSVYPNKNGTSYTAQYRLEDGRLRRETYPTSEAAQARLDEIAQLKAGEYQIAAGLQTVEQWLTEWLDLRRRGGLAVRTVEGYTQIIESYILPRIGSHLLHEVRSHHLQGLVSHVEDDIKARSGGRYSGTRTVHLVTTVLWQSFRLAHKRRLIPFHPMDGVLVPTHRKARVNPANEVLLLGVLREAHQSPLPALWYSYVLLGLRRGEPLGWQWADLDLSKATARVEHQAQALKGGVQIIVPKRDSIRTLPMPEPLVALLRQRQTEQQREFLRAGKVWSVQTLVFAGPEGLSWPTTVNHWWHELRDRVGLPETFHLHHLRHSYMTLLEDAGVSEAVKRLIAGHAPKNVTQQYTHQRVSTMRKFMDIVTEQILRAGDEDRATGGS